MRNLFLEIKKRIKKLANGEYPIDFIVYKAFSKQKEISKSFPFTIYRIVEKKIKQIGCAKELDLPTYDGLDQSTHPTICKYNGIYYLAATPFPYGNDLYENPCVYKSKDGEHFAPIEGGYPLVKPSEHDQLIYLSDPYLYVEKDKLCLIYRECAYYDNDSYIANLYKIEMDKEDKWSKPVKIFECCSGAMSPCLTTEGEKQFLYYVSFSGNNTILMKKSIDDDEEETVLVEGIPFDMMLWHIDIFRMEDSTVTGLFTIAADHYGSKARLFVAKQENGKWIVGNEIIFDEQLITKMYKASMVQLNDASYRLYVSLRRKDRKWKIYYVDYFRFQDYI